MKGRELRIAFFSLCPILTIFSIRGLAIGYKESNGQLDLWFLGFILIYAFAGMIVPIFAVRAELRKS